MDSYEKLEHEIDRLNGLNGDLVDLLRDISGTLSPHNQMKHRIIGTLINNEAVKNETPFNPVVWPYPSSRETVNSLAAVLELIAHDATMTALDMAALAREALKSK